MSSSLLAGLRIVECSMLGPGAVCTPLADLGADVIKVEPPGGDYIRQMSWPIIEGSSLLHLHVSRGKRSIVLDLTTDGGRATFLDLAASADAVVEAMRIKGSGRSPASARRSERITGGQRWAGSRPRQGTPIPEESLSPINQIFTP